MAKGKTPQPGDNSKLNDQQEQALFLHGLTKVERLKKAKDEANSHYRNARKVMVSDGFTPDEIDFAIKLRDDKDNELADVMRRRARIARWLGDPIIGQPDLFDQPNRKTANESAYEHGLRDGMMDEPLASPFDASTTQHSRYVDGWHEGQHRLEEVKQAEADANELEQFGMGEDDTDEAVTGPPVAEEEPTA